jgi:hypothetical protein
VDVTASGLAGARGGVDARIKRGRADTRTRSAAYCAALLFVVWRFSFLIRECQAISTLSICDASYILISSPMFRIDAVGEFSVANVEFSTYSATREEKEDRLRLLA